MLQENAEPNPQPSTSMQSGTIVGGRYELLKLIDDGRTGLIYQARHINTEAIVALKIIHRKLIADEKWVGRFQQEARILAALHHPNIVGIKAIDVDENGGCFLVTEFVDGISLADKIKQDGKLSQEQFQKIFAQAATALAYAHSKNIIHRDIRPSNIIIANADSGNEQVKILDFGLSKLLGADSKQTTQSGICISNPHYMSPEQCKGAVVDHRCDIYSLGCVMYEALTGAPPFQGKNPLQIAAKHISEPLPPVEDRDLKFLMRVVVRAAAKDPDARYQSMDQLLTALRDGESRIITAIGTSAPRKQKKLIPILGSVAAAAMLFVGAFAWLSSQRHGQWDINTSQLTGGIGSIYRKRTLPLACDVVHARDQLNQNEKPSESEIEKVNRASRQGEDGYLKKLAHVVLAVYYDDKGDKKSRDTHFKKALDEMHSHGNTSPSTAEQWALYLKRDGEETKGKKVLEDELKYCTKEHWLGDAEDLKSMIMVFSAKPFERPKIQ